MKCGNCDKPALYSIGPNDFPVCIDCFLKVQQANQIQQEMYEREINQLSAEMAFIVGVPDMSPKYPERPRPVQIHGATLNNIKIEGSSIGVLNTGNIGAIDSAITVIGSSGDQLAAEALKLFSEATLKSNELSDQQKNEVMEMLSVVASEASVAKPNRRGAAILPILKGIGQTVSTVAAVTTIWQRVEPVIRTLFS